MITVVVIGRNEQRSLAAALEAVKDSAAGCGLPHEIVYVDSGSTDGSMRIARDKGVRCLSLTPPFNAARARNLGFWATKGKYVQFVDGDMVLHPAWIGRAVAALEASREISAVEGLLQERNAVPTKWNTGFGGDWATCEEDHDVRRLGGASMWRRARLSQLDGFDPCMSVGEDPDLSLRAVKSGHRLLRLASPMAEHDLALASAQDWWTRGLAVGRSRALVALKHSGDPEVREQAARPITFLLVSSLMMAFAWSDLWAALVVVVGAVALFVRHFLRDLARGDRRFALIHTFHVYAIKVPVALGVLQVSARRVLAQGAK